MQNLNEIQEFLLFLVEGAIIGFFFDLFRSARNCFHKTDIITYLEDFVFLSISSIIIIWTIIFVCNGVIRLYIFLGLLLGITAYALTISKICVIIITSGMDIGKSFFTFMLKIMKKLGKLFKL